jgi:Rps23 Pro-64 3,4-dihydroxylase Tpa1-like proline 4-hydroxylase
MSSVGVYAPAEKFVEDTVWKTLPSEADWFPSWSKRTGELLLEAYKVQYGYDKWSIIRPANIFGEYDDFSGQGTVISSSIKKIYEANDKIECWGDGSPIRDFVFGADVADAVFKMYDNRINDIVNFGAGEEITIKSMIDNLIEISGKNIEVSWDTTKPNGDLRRQMDVTKQTSLGLLPKTKFKDALAKTYYYYLTQFPVEGLPFNVRELLTKGYITGKTENIIVDNAQFYHHIDSIIEKSKDKKDYTYRFEFHNTDNLTHNYKHSINKEEIEERDNYVKENGYDVIQRWGEFAMTSNYREEQQYLRSIVEKLVTPIYPDLKDNIYHNDSITLYEKGDFITPHTDGLNPRRCCVVLIYLSYKEDYNDGGGKLVLGCGDDIEGYVEPINENYTIIDFTKGETLHAVEEVKNDFKRYTYIDFVYNKKLQNVWEKNQNLI